MEFFGRCSKKAMVCSGCFWLLREKLQEAGIQHTAIYKKGSFLELFLYMLNAVDGMRTQFDKSSADDLDDRRSPGGCEASRRSIYPIPSAIQTSALAALFLMADAGSCFTFLFKPITLS